MKRQHYGMPLAVLAVAGLSFRQNEEGARQIEEVLAVLGIRLLRVPLAGHALHIDGQLVMVDDVGNVQAVFVLSDRARRPAAGRT